MAAEPVTMVLVVYPKSRNYKPTPIAFRAEGLAAETLHKIATAWELSPTDAWARLAEMNDDDFPKSFVTAWEQLEKGDLGAIGD